LWSSDNFRRRCSGKPPHRVSDAFHRQRPAFGASGAAREKLGTILGLREIEKLSSYQTEIFDVRRVSNQFDLANLELEAGASDELLVRSVTLNLGK